MMNRAQMYEKFVEYQRLRDQHASASKMWWFYQRKVVVYFKKVYAKEMRGEQGP